MSLKSYLIMMSLGTVFCWAAWIFIIFNISPEEGGFVPLISFYFSLFLAIVGSFSVLGFMIRNVILKNEEAVFKHVRHTFRQSVFIAFIIITILFLLSKNLLFWWNTVILIALFLMLEAIFFTNRKDFSEIKD